VAGDGEGELSRSSVQQSTHVARFTSAFHHASVDDAKVAEQAEHVAS
jgi:hypothetical protein